MPRPDLASNPVFKGLAERSDTTPEWQSLPACPLGEVGQTVELDGAYERPVLSFAVRAWSGSHRLAAAL